MALPGALAADSIPHSTARSHESCPGGHFIVASSLISALRGSGRAEIIQRVTATSKMSLAIFPFG